MMSSLIDGKTISYVSRVRKTWLSVISNVEMWITG